jgi:hypothetical protein
MPGSPRTRATHVLDGVGSVDDERRVETVEFVDALGGRHNRASTAKARGEKGTLATARSDQPLERGLEFRQRDVDVLEHAPIQHRRRYGGVVAFALGLGEDVEDDPFEAGQAIADVWEIVGGRHSAPA